MGMDLVDQWLIEPGLFVLKYIVAKKNNLIFNSQLIKMSVLKNTKS